VALLLTSNITVINSLAVLLAVLNELVQQIAGAPAQSSITSELSQFKAVAGAAAAYLQRARASTAADPS
jgi:hypothetical protein